MSINARVSDPTVGRVACCLLPQSRRREIATARATLEADRIAFERAKAHEWEQLQHESERIRGQAVDVERDRQSLAEQVLCDCVCVCV